MSAPENPLVAAFRAWAPGLLLALTLEALVLALPSPGFDEPRLVRYVRKLEEHPARRLGACLLLGWALLPGPRPSSAGPVPEPPPRRGPGPPPEPGGAP